jgi:hypothetical protein
MVLDFALHFKLKTGIVQKINYILLRRYNTYTIKIFNFPKKPLKKAIK